MTTEADTYRRIEAAPYAPESLRERVAAAICAADSETHGVDWAALDEYELNTYRRLADAAIAVMRGEL